MLLRKLRRHYRRKAVRDARKQARTPCHGAASVELMEPRLLLSAEPVIVGAVYIEEDLGNDLHGDIIEISFEGGAPGTQLTQIAISGDQNASGFNVGDVFFDIASEGLGADAAFAPAILQQDGIDRVTATVDDGTTDLVLEFEGFEAGEKLILSIDVDEVEIYDALETDLTIVNEGFDPITSGVEFQGSTFNATFTAPHYYPAEAIATFVNRYDDEFAGTQLNLSPDDVGGKRDRTAGGVGQVVQEPIPAQLGGHVYHDENQNGVRDEGEDGIGGVTIRAIPIDTVGEQQELTTLTNAGGEYLFEDLSPGTYRLVEVEQPPGYLDGLDAAGTVDGQPSGQAENPGDAIDQIVLQGASVGVNYDFGEILPVSISGYVHLADENGDCFNEETYNEPIAGAIVMIEDAYGNLIAETTTDEEGYYQFIGLSPGVYTIIEVTPEGLIDGGAQAGTVNGEGRGIVEGPGRIASVQLTSGQSAVRYDFCELEPVSISGYVRLANSDGDCFGEEDYHEPVVGATIMLEDATGRVIAQTVTDPAGFYSFTALPPGVYSVVEVTPEGLIDGAAQAGTVSGEVNGIVDGRGRITQIVLTSGQDGIQYDFCEEEPVSISGFVHLSDADGDCFGDAESNRPLSGVTVRLLDEAGQTVATTTTDESGRYQFVDLLPGVYSVVETTPAWLIDGAAQIGFVDGERRGSVVDSSHIANIQLNSGQQAVHYDFCEHEPSTLSGFVYHDRDNDGNREAGEEAIGGVRLSLVDAQQQVVAETVTDSSGYYEFTGLYAGRYTIRETQPAGWIDGLDTPGHIDGRPEGVASTPGDAISRIQLRWSEVGRDFNFGELRPGSIAGRIHSDLDSDCLMDEDEQPISGVRVELRNAAGQVVDSTRTDAHGRYRFDGLAPGAYSVREIQPSGYFQGSQRAGSGGGDDSTQDVIRNIIVASGDVLTDYDFCEEPPSAISGFVFQDGPAISLEEGELLPDDISTVRDGRLTPDDRRLPNVTVQLRDGVTGVPILAQDNALPGSYPDGPITTVTDARGFYSFDHLRKGNYSVFQLQPDGFIDGWDTSGTIPSVAINRNVDIEPEILASLEADPNFDAIVRIALPPGQVSEMNNFSEVIITRDRLIVPFDGPEPAPVPPPYQIQLPVFESRPVVVEPLEYQLKPYGNVLAAWAYTWHLSVIAGGLPRGDGEIVDARGPIWFVSSNDYQIGWYGTSTREMKWTLMTQDGETMSLQFGEAGSIPISGDFNGDGLTEVGVFTEGQWFIDLDGDGTWDREDLWAKLGHKGDLPVTGDWDGDGKDDIGIYGLAWPGDPRAVGREPGLPDRDGQANGNAKNVPPNRRDAIQGDRALKRTAEGETRSDVIDHVFHYGAIGDYPVTGDWNGDGVSTIGVFYRGVWHLDQDGDGHFSIDTDTETNFGSSGDVPVVGDFNGDGVDEIGVYRKGKFILDTNRNYRIDDGDQVMQAPPGRPVVGDWDGDGWDDVGVVQEPSTLAEDMIRFVEIDPR